MKASTKIGPRRISVHRDHRVSARRLCYQSGLLFLRVEKEAVRAVIEIHLPAIIKRYIKSGTIPLPRVPSKSSGRIAIGLCNRDPASSILAEYPSIFGRLVLTAALERAIEAHYLPEIEQAIKRRFGVSDPRQPDLGL